jgi:hypothetical protein
MSVVTSQSTICRKLENGPKAVLLTFAGAGLVPSARLRKE